MEDDLIRKLLEGCAKIDPRDRRDTEIHLSAGTAKVLAMSTIHGEKFAFEDRYTDGAMLFGITCRRDETLPFGEFRFVTENAQERAMRRIVADGRTTINVMKPVALMPELLPAPKPTLRALLRHWLRRRS